MIRGPSKTIPAKRSALVLTVRLLILATLVVAPEVACAPRLKEPPPLVGDWKVLQTFEGKDKVKYKTHTFVLTADGRSEARDERGETIATGKFATNPTTLPAEIVFISDKPVNPDDATRLGIYRLDGDRLTIAVSLKGTRPKTFEPVDDASVMLTILERKK